MLHPYPPTPTPTLHRRHRPTSNKAIATSIANETSTMDPPAAPVAEAIPLVTPLNLLLASVAAYLVYLRFKPTTLPTLPSPPPPLLYKSYTPRALLRYNGTDEPRVLLAVKGTVFDVSAGRSFYGPGGPYSIFAGRDASRGLAKGVLEESLLTDVDKPIDDLSNLTGEEREVLNGWFETFEGKYLVVGELVNEGQEEK
ncbi:Neudesin [Drechslerella dactyloides]|uniref:Neudesin n=1 Tax=Drechslerella dactyloides TaxID=74499 RepID=A0AAD6J1F2_DREDA|nr:Neudesin [Drechslerella dactyloides]